MVKGKRGLLIVLFYTALALGAVFAAYRGYETYRAMRQIHDVSLGQFQGPADAKKIIVEFMDYRCSYCRAMHPVMQEVLARHPDVKLIYRHYLVFGRPSVIDAEVALAAGMQGKYIEAHNALIARETPMSEDEIGQMVRDLGLDSGKFYTDMKGPEIGDLLLNTLDIAEVLRIGATPTFIVGDIIYRMGDAAPTPEAFDKLLVEAYGE